MNTKNTGHRCRNPPETHTAWDPEIRTLFISSVVKSLESTLHSLRAHLLKPHIISRHRSCSNTKLTHYHVLNPSDYLHDQHEISRNPFRLTPQAQFLHSNTFQAAISLKNYHRISPPSPSPPPPPSQPQQPPSTPQNLHNLTSVRHRPLRRPRPQSRNHRPRKLQIILLLLLHPLRMLLLAPLRRRLARLVVSIRSSARPPLTSLHQHHIQARKQWDRGGEGKK